MVSTIAILPLAQKQSTVRNEEESGNEAGLEERGWGWGYESQQQAPASALRDRPGDETRDSRLFFFFFFFN